MSYADRVERIQPSLTLKINAEAAAIQADHRGGDAVARLGAGEPDFATPDGVKRAAHQAIDQGFTHYTAVDGYDGLKHAVREKFRRDNDLHFQDDQILVTCGAKQALYDLCQTLLRPGDEAVVPRPYWVTYPAQVTLAEAQTVYLDLDAEDGYRPRAERLDAALTDATRLVFLNSPNNPTGRLYDRDTLNALAAVLRRYPRVFVVSDDIYEHLNWTGQPFRNLLNVAPDLADRCFIVNGVSKAYAMTGWRVGYAAGPVELIRAMTTIQSQSTTNASSISQAAARAALTGDQSFVAEACTIYKERHDFVIERLNQIPGFECRPGDGAFYAFPDVTGAIERRDVVDDTALCEILMAEAGVALVPGAAFGAPGHLRLSFAADIETLTTALRRIEEFMAP